MITMSGARQCAEVWLEVYTRGKINQALLGIGRVDFLGFSSIDLTLSLDFQGVGKA